MVIALQVLEQINSDDTLKQKQKLIIMCKLLRYMDEEAFNFSFTSAFVKLYSTMFECLIKSTKFTH